MLLDCFKYLWLPLDVPPEEIIQQYNMQEVMLDGWVNIKMWKGMYSLPQAGILAKNSTNAISPRIIAAHMETNYFCVSGEWLWNQISKSATC